MRTTALIIIISVLGITLNAQSLIVSLNSSTTETKVITKPVIVQ